MKTLLVDGVSIELEDGVSANLIEKTLSKLETRVADAEKSKQTVADELEALKKSKSTEDAKFATEITTRDATIATLQTQLKDTELTPEKLNKLVADRHEVITKSRAILGDAAVIDGKTDKEIRRQVVDSKMGETAKGWTDEMISASFAAITKDVKIDDAAQSGNFNDMARAFSKSGQAANTMDAIYAEYDRELSGGGKTN